MVTKIVGTVAGHFAGGVVGMLIGIGVGTLTGYVTVAVYAAKDGLFSMNPDLFVLGLVACMDVLVKVL